MRVSRHNSRSGNNSAKHNDRNFNTADSLHIHEEEKEKNVYWDCYQGFRLDGAPKREDPPVFIFGHIEEMFYSNQYFDYRHGQHDRNTKTRHTERDKNADDLLHGIRTQPEETILQVGNIDESIDEVTLINIMDRYQKWFEETFGSNVHILDWALHMDETTPHVHERHVFDYTNRYGETEPCQEKALEALGIERPYPDKPKGRMNCRKITFDKICREKFQQICKEAGLKIETDPVYGGRGYLEKQDFIIENQKKRLLEKETELKDLTMKVSDLDELITGISDEAYETAVNKVTDLAVRETADRYQKVISDYGNFLVSPKTGLPEREVNLIRKAFDALTGKIERSSETIRDKMRKALRLPGTEQPIKQEVRAEIRESVLEKLERKKETDTRPNAKQEKDDRSAVPEKSDFEK
jgi:hypothetical protein